MKGLLLKEYYIIKPHIKGMLLSIIYSYGVLLIFTSLRSKGAISVLLPYVLVRTVKILMESDEQSKWDIQALTMPYSTKQIVTVKYLFPGILTLMGSIIGFLATIIMNFFSKDLPLEDNIRVALTGFCIALLSLIVFIPIGYKYGTKRATSIALITYLAPIFVPFILSKIFDFKTIFYEGSLLYNSLKFGTPLALIIMVVVSILISIKIYSKKEF